MKEKKRDIIFLRWLPLLLINVYVEFPKQKDIKE